MNESLNTCALPPYLSSELLSPRLLSKCLTQSFTGPLGHWRLSSDASQHEAQGVSVSGSRLDVVLASLPHVLAIACALNPILIQNRLRAPTTLIPGEITRSVIRGLGDQRASHHSRLLCKQPPLGNLLKRPSPLRLKQPVRCRCLQTQQAPFDTGSRAETGRKTSEPLPWPGASRSVMKLIKAPLRVKSNHLNSHCWPAGVQSPPRCSLLVSWLRGCCC